MDTGMLDIGLVVAAVWSALHVWTGPNDQGKRGQLLPA